MNSAQPAKGGAQALPQRARIEERIRKFEAMPAFVAQVIAMLNNPRTDALEIAGRIKMDPGMPASILRLANSAQFGAQRQVSSLQEAIVRLGLKQLCQLIVASGMGRRLSRPLPGYELRPDELLSHSLFTALGAEEICKALAIDTPDMLFTAGLLHDLGKLITDESVAAEKENIRARVRDQRLTYDTAEAQTLGLHHAEAGGRIIDGWNFPAQLVAAARWHHRPEDAGVWQNTVAIVHIAEFLAYSEGIGTGIDGLDYGLSQVAVDNLGLKKTTLELVASRALERMRLLQPLLQP